MKPRTEFVIIVGLLVLVLGIAWLTFPDRDQAVTQTFPATIQRDCAPWDGAAFTVQIALQGGDAIHISIWQSPELKLPKTFSFPDDTGQVGNASLMHSTEAAEQLSGKVSFSSVKQGSPAEGRFELFTDTGEGFTGEFHAEWQDKIALCG